MSATATRTMRAVVLARPGAAHAREVPLPEPCDEEVLVRLEGCGVCVSSLPLWEGRPGFAYPAEPGAPGHEAWGVEVESGRRVAVLSDRGYSEYEAVPASATVPLPPELEDVPFPGEAVACALNVFARSGIACGDTVGVVGTGFLGLLLVQLAAHAGARVLAFSRRETALALARSFGAETPAELEDECCDVAIEAAGGDRRGRRRGGGGGRRSGRRRNARLARRAACGGRGRRGDRHAERPPRRRGRRGARAWRAGVLPEAACAGRGGRTARGRRRPCGGRAPHGGLLLPLHRRGAEAARRDRVGRARRDLRRRPRR